MDEHGHHNDLVEGIAKQFAHILDNSEQGIYIYFDDDHKICNEKFAKMLEYDTAEEWGRMTGSFPDVFVAEESQEVLISAYQDAMEKSIASESKISWKKKDGATIDTKVIIVPVAFDDHLLAIHFVSK